MKTINYTNARLKLRTLIDECVENEEPVTVTSKNGNDVVILSKHEFYLLKGESDG